MALAEQLAFDSAVRFVSTDAVLFEFLAAVSRRGPQARVNAVDYVERLRRQRRVHVVKISDLLLDSTLDLYRRRPDKTSSLADSLGMVVCTQMGITDVLTSDADYEQEGFIRLLKPSSRRR
jgi:predicted nucleic acid-binding protein